MVPSFGSRFTRCRGTFWKGAYSTWHLQAAKGHPWQHAAGWCIAQEMAHRSHDGPGRHSPRLLHRRRPRSAPLPANGAPELRAALADKGVAVPGGLEARHVGDVLEPQVRTRVQQLLGAAPPTGMAGMLLGLPVSPLFHSKSRQVLHRE